jgi:CRP-like cAMP-binding protein
MARDDKVGALAGVQLFSSLNKKELGLIARAADVATAKAGDNIVNEGEVGHEFYLILEGAATVRRNRRKVTDLGAGDYFGEMALLDGGPRAATVTADTDLRLLIIGQREFGGILESVPNVAHKLLTGMAARLRVTDAKAFSH